MTESSIQDAIHRRLNRKGHRLICPNVGAWGWESDLISVTKSDYTVEYEIKCDRSDFRRDKDKDRHRYLEQAHERSDLEHTRFMRRGYGPCRFFYVFDPDMKFRDLDVPDHAGVMTVSAPNDYGHRYPKEIKKAPRLHGQNMHDDVRRYLERGLTWRYWEERKA